MVLLKKKIRRAGAVLKILTTQRFKKLVVVEVEY
jgi:hypothetical protein